MLKNLICSVKPFNNETMNELVQDEESLKCEIKTSVLTMKQNVDLSEDNLLSQLHNIFEGYQAELPEQKANVNNL